MPLTNDTNRSREEFCAALKATRERRGLTLERIAEVTKVCPTHFVNLERNDLRAWPKGIFRRTFFRSYVEMIGLPAADMLEEFQRLFPEDDGAAKPPPAAANNAPLRLELDTNWHGVKPPLRSRVITASIDGVFVTMAALAFAWRLGTDFSTTTAVFSLSYFLLAAVVLGESPSAWTWRRRNHWLIKQALEFAKRALPKREAANPEAQPAAEGQPAEKRQWVTDARRVRPRDETGMRVRIKWSPHSGAQR